MERFKVAIVIPAYDEANTIGKVVKSILSYGTVIVVNDASTDDTSKKAKEAGAIVVNHLENKGYDGALNSGFKRASKLNCNAIITFDADGQHSFSVLPQYINQLKNGVDLVLGVRPKSQRIAESIFKMYVRYSGTNWSDPLCGMKGYSIELYQAQGYFDSLQSIGTELAAYGIDNRYKYVEINIPISIRKGNPRFGSIVRSNIMILKALLNLIKKRS